MHIYVTVPFAAVDMQTRHVQPRYEYYASLEILEENGNYKKAELYRRKDCTSIIALHFCDDEFEGLDGNYSMTDDKKIWDSEGSEIHYRNMSKLKPPDASENISTAERIAANVQSSKVYEESTFLREHAVVRKLNRGTNKTFMYKHYAALSPA